MVEWRKKRALKIVLVAWILNDVARFVSTASINRLYLCLSHIYGKNGRQSTGKEKINHTWNIPFIFTWIYHRFFPHDKILLFVKLASCNYNNQFNRPVKFFWKSVQISVVKTINIYYSWMNGNKREKTQQQKKSRILFGRWPPFISIYL